MPYSDYFALRDGYYAVTSKYSIEDPKNHWQDTYPHDTFVDLLKRATRMLERPDGDADARKPLWIEGAYGTGKTRIAWTLGELLTCSPKELDDYFEEYPELREKVELKQRLQGVKRDNRIVVAMRYDSSDIANLDDLVRVIYESVAEALEKRDYDTVAGKSINGALLNYLNDETNQNILTQIFQASPYCHDGNIPATGQEARNILLQPGDHQALIRALLRIGRERNLLALRFDMQTLCEWLREVIEANNLKGLVLILDEFSDFLYNNRGSFSTFQQLAQLSASIPFYLVVVTHHTSMIFTQDEQSAKKLLDRFHRHIVTLPEYTAFKLIGHALTVKAGMEEEWSNVREDLNFRLDEARRAVRRLVPKLEEADLKAILPIHPFAALVLKNVATLFDANQRSMFEFIAVKDEDAHAFQWFIQTHEPAELLAIDHLWDYFYATGRGRHGGGRDNLESRARDVLDVYPNLARKFPGDEENGRPEARTSRRVLKTVIMLQALRLISPHTKFFEATKNNLRIAFEGIDGLEQGIGLTELDRLVNEKVLFVDNEIYQVPLGQAIDQSAILKMAEGLKSTQTTAKLIESFKPWDILPANEALSNKRVAIRKATVADFRKTLNSLIQAESHDWEIKALMLFARNAVEADEMNGLLKEALADSRANNIYFIDATAMVMADEKYENLLLARARQSYFSGKDDSQARAEGLVAESLLRDWQAELIRGKFALYSSKFPEGKHIPTGDELICTLKEEILARYPECCDFLPGVVDTHFKTPTITAIEAGVRGEAGTPVTKQQADMLLDKVRGDKYWKVVDHPLSRLKKEIERKMERAFAAGGAGRISIGEIADMLMKKGFMPNLLSAYLTAYLLKEYAGSEYRFSDGETGDVMTAKRLAEMIRDYYQKLNNPAMRYRDQYIEVLTREQRDFVELAKKLFNMDGTESLDAIAIRIGESVKNWGYPFWAFKHATESVGLEAFIEQFARLLNPQANGASGYGEVASEIGRLIRANPHAETGLKVLLCQENLENGMRSFLHTWQDGEFEKLADEIHAEDPLRDIRASFGNDAAWLWNRDIGEAEIEAIMQGYRLAAQSVRKGFLPQANSRESCLEGWQQKLARLHLPVAVLQERYPEQKAVLGILRELAKKGTLLASHEKKLYEAIAGDAQKLGTIFDNALDLFKTIYANILKDLGEDDQNALYRDLPASSFTDDRQVYEDELRVRAKSRAAGLKRAQLMALWKEKTGVETPADLSGKLGTPLDAILSQILPNTLYEDARSACDAINNPNATEKQIMRALSFWGNNPENVLGKIVDQSVADEAFVNVIHGNYKPLLNVEKTRAAMRKELGNNVHAWLNNPQWSKIPRLLAVEEYRSNRMQAVLDKIMAMTPDEAKKMLLKLGQDDMETGLKIILG